GGDRIGGDRCPGTRQAPAQAHMHTPSLPDPAAEAGAAHPAPPPGPRVVFITHYAELYGANLSLLNLIEGLGRHAVRPRVIAPEQGALPPELARRGVPAAVLPFEWWVSPRRTLPGAAARLLGNLRRLRPLAAQLTGWGCDLVYSNSSVFAVGAAA